MLTEGEKSPTATTTIGWVTYVWLDRNGEPRSIQTRQTVARRHIGETVLDAKPEDYDDLMVECDVSGYPSRTDALHFARPFRVYSQPGAASGKILLCHIVDTAGSPLNSAVAKAVEDLRQLQEEEGEGYCPTEVFEITQQFYLTTKFVPLSFASNPPAKPGPFGSGVGADLAVARATVTRAVNSLPGESYITRLTPLATPSHWGVTFRLRKATGDRNGEGNPYDLASMLMLFRYVLGRACEESNLTPAFIGKLLKDPWPPSLLQFSARTKELSELKLAKRLAAGHESLMRATAPTQDAATAEVEKYVWVTNAKGPVTVATTQDGTAWLLDNRVYSSANPHVAVNEWIKSWRTKASGDGAATA